MRFPFPRTSSKGFLIAFFALACSLSLSHLWGIYTFLTNPQSHYFRAWEFTEEVLYRTKSFGHSWIGTEEQDRTRDNLFFYPTGRMTKVTIDEYGYRQSVAPTSTPSGIAVAGDSQAWGSGLSDEETIASRIGAHIGGLVANISRQPVCLGLQHPRMKDRGTILLVITERNIAGAGFPLPCPENPKLVPLPRDLSPLELLKTTEPARYSPPLKLFRAIEAFGGDIKTLLNGGPLPRLYYPYQMKEQHLYDAIERYTRDFATLETQGFRLVLMPLPTKATLYDPDADIFKRTYLERFYTMMDAAGLPYVDTLTPLRAHMDEPVYFPYDTHLSPRGAEIVAEAAVKFLRSSAP